MLSGLAQSGELARVMVEHDLLHGRVERHRLELAETARVRRLDDDQPADGVELEA